MEQASISDCSRWIIRNGLSSNWFPPKLNGENILSMYINYHFSYPKYFGMFCCYHSMIYIWIVPLFLVYIDNLSITKAKKFAESVKTSEFNIGCSQMKDGIIVLTNNFLRSYGCTLDMKNSWVSIGALWLRRLPR